MSGKDVRFLLLNACFGVAYATFNVFFFSLFGQFNRESVLVSVLLGVGAFVSTCSIRFVATRARWMSLSMPSMLLRLCVAVILATCLTLAVEMAGLGLVRLLIPRASTAVSAPFNIWVVFGYWLNIAVLIGLWTALWAGWSISRRYQQVEIARLRAESDRSVLELAVLRARLNPHFVFNALNNVRALINEDPDRARDVVTRLSGILRHALEHTERERATLAEELAVVDDYLAVESVHYEDRLQVRQDIDAASRQAELPPMVLQLLVENAIKHGISRTPGGGILDIRARCPNKHLLLEVANPGTLKVAGGEGFGVGLTWMRTQMLAISGSHFEINEVDGRVVARLEVKQ